MKELRTPYRLVIFGSRKIGKRVRECAWDGWTPTQAYKEARLPSAGSFLYPGLFAVRRAAMDALALPNVTQVQVRTNQDRKVYLFNKFSDGRISGYRPDNERY